MLNVFLDRGDVVYDSAGISKILGDIPDGAYIRTLVITHEII